MLADALTIYTVSEYRVYRCYGGPEEGGWWYDWEDHVQVVGYFMDPDEAIDHARELNEKWRAEAEADGHYFRDSVLGEDGDTMFCMEDFPGEFQTTEHPHYC